MQALKTIRNSIREQRRSLNVSEQKSASQSLHKRLTQHPLFLRSQYIAIYWPNDGEINPIPVLETAWKMGKHCYLPALAPLNKKLIFSRYKKGQALATNKYGIPEPLTSNSSQIPAWALDLVITPLVAFDQKGNRIGMGGGYYDRTFCFKVKSPTCKPALVGVGHQFQRIDKIPQRRWDVPLDLAVTDCNLFEF